MQQELDSVCSFHQKYGFEIASQPTLLTGDLGFIRLCASQLRGLQDQCTRRAPGNLLESRLALSLEELAEWLEAHVEQDLEAAADAWGDRLYVLLGDAVAAGLPGDEIFCEIHRSNMSKTRPSDISEAKGIKGDGYSSPSLHHLLFGEPKSK